MTIERNFEFQLAETWHIYFEAEDSLIDATLEFALAQAGTVILNIDDTDSPSIFIIDSPAVSGSIDIAPDRQDYSTSPSAGLAIQPGAFNYEIRANYLTASPEGVITVLQYGKIIVQASLFAWPPI